MFMTQIRKIESYNRKINLKQSFKLNFKGKF